MGTERQKWPWDLWTNGEFHIIKADGIAGPAVAPQYHQEARRRGLFARTTMISGANWDGNHLGVQFFKTDLERKLHYHKPGSYPPPVTGWKSDEDFAE